MSTTSAAASSMVASSQRPIPLQMRNDLRIERIEYRGLGSYVIKDPVGLKYHRLQYEQFRVLELLDGMRSLENIRDDLAREFPMLTFGLIDVQNLIADLHEKGLLQSNRPGQGESLVKIKRKRRKDKIKGAFKSLLYVRLPGWDPERTLQWLYPRTRWLFHPWVVWICISLVCSSLLLITVQFNAFRSQLPEFQQFFGWPNLIYLWMTLGIAKIIHEFGHGLSCKHYGGECHEMGVMLLVFSPCLYCDVTDSWMLKNKWKRFTIGGAGMYIETIISAIAVFVWWQTGPGMLHHLCLNLFFVTTITTVIFNANPLMRFDGYYMLSDFLEIPNLRPKADKYLRDSFAWYCLGIESRPDPFMPETGRVWFLLFAVAAAVYRWVILFGITIFLYTVLKPYGLQSIGIAMAVVSIGGILFSMLMNCYRIISAPRIDPLSVPKISITVTILIFLTVGALLIPLPLHVESAFLLEPHNVSHVATVTSGRLAQFDVKPGQRVSEGDLLAHLENENKEDQLRALELEEWKLRIHCRTLSSMNDLTAEELALKRLDAVREQLQDFRGQMEALTVVAPISGTVVAPARIPEPKLDLSAHRLNTWNGTPLDAKNIGSFLEEGTQLLSIAPDDTLDATLLIDQGDRNDLQEKQEVEIKFEHLPHQTFVGTIREISDQNLEFAPTALSNKAGGELPTVTDAQGRERLADGVYQATVHISKNAHLLLPGMRGRARFVVDRRSAGEWIWRYLRRTFHFRL